MNLQLSRVKWKNESNFIFVTLERKLNGEECDLLCEKYLRQYRELTVPGEALWVDLRPAFEKPLNNVTPNAILPVPLDFTLPV